MPTLLLTFGHLFNLFYAYIFYISGALIPTFIFHIKTTNIIQNPYFSCAFMYIIGSLLSVLPTQPIFFGFCLSLGLVITLFPSARRSSVANTQKIPCHSWCCLCDAIKSAPQVSFELCHAI